MNKETTIIELNGVKLEVDLRTAKRVDTLRVGDRVRLLEKSSYSSSVTVHHGIIAGFEPFPSAPTIIVAYLKQSYKEATIEFVYLNTASEDAKQWEIVPSIDNDLPVNKEDVVASINRKIDGKMAEIQDLERQRDYFLREFGKYFPSGNAA